MLIRNAYRAVCLCLGLGAVALGQGNQYVFQLPGAASTSGQFFPYIATGNPLAPAPAAGATGPAGLLQVIPKPDGTKFYLLGTPGTNMLQSVDPTFTTFHNVTGLGSERATAATVTPDGKALLVATSGGLYIIDAATDAAGSSLALPGSADFTTAQTPCPACWIAVSRDSNAAYVLTNFAGFSDVTKFNLATKQKVGSSLVLNGGDATSITLSPLGLLYVTAGNQLTEINPSTLTVTSGGLIPLAFYPGPLRFSPDGTIAFSTNKTPGVAGHSLLELTVGTHGIQYWPPTFVSTTFAPLIDDVLVASNTSIFAVSSTLATLYDVNPSPLSVVTPSALGALTGLPALVTTVSAAVVSNELPAAKFMYLFVNNGSQYLYRVNLSSNTIDTSGLAGLTTGILEFAAVPPQTGAASFLQLNNFQTLAAGATSLPLIARVLNTNGQPVFNVPVTFTAADPASGLVISTPASNSNADGYVQTTVTMPATPGAYSVTLNANGVVTTFTLTIPGAGGGGGGGGFSQVTIVSGDGQLIDQNTPTTDPFDPLTLLVTDTDGKPLPNVPVGFSVTTGGGNLYGSSLTTDVNGLASTNFQPQFTAGTGAQFQTFVINATTQYGAVDFTVVELPIVQNQGAVNFELLTPTIDSGTTVTVGQGDVLANGVSAKIYSNIATGAPIPGVGIRIAAIDGITASTAASCQGSSLSDKTGIASCNVIAQCQAGPLPQTFPVFFRIGDFKNFPGLVTVTPGHTTVISATSGNNQTGKAGQLLTTPLIATISDGCKTATPGVTVTWTVTKGSATLTNTKTISDSRGQVSTQVTFGSAPGGITIQVSVGTSQAVFSLISQVTVGGITLQSGNNQTAIAGDQFANALVFLVRDTNNNPIPGTTVNFSVTSGSAGVNPATQLTSPQGTVSTTVTAGATAGTIIVTATAGSSSTTATLTSQPRGPIVTTTSFVNADSLAVGLVPCGRATVTGNGIVPSVQGTLSGFSPLAPLPYVLGGFSLTINGVAAPLESVSNVNGVQSATFQTPCETLPGTATVVAQANGGTSTVTGVTVFQAQPGVHAAAGANGKPYGYVICSNGTITPANPAHRGDTCYVVVTGLGQTTPAARTNNVGVAGQNVNVQIVVGVSNSGVPVVSAQYLQGWNGFYLVGFQIPANSPIGSDQPLAVAAVLSNGQPVFGNPVFLGGVTN